MADKKIDAVELFSKVLTPAKRKEAFAIFTGVPTRLRNERLCAILGPAMADIDEFTGQTNELRYFGYLLEHVFYEVGEF